MRAAIAAIAVLWIATTWVSAGASSLPTPILEASPTIRSGDRVVFRWSPLGPDVEELELLLSTDGGRTYPLRVSPELEGSVDRYVWRVPNLSAPEARVRIRARIADRECEGPPSLAFAITANRAPAERWLFREAGGWGDHEVGSRVPFGLGTPRPSRTLGVDETLPSPDAPARFALPVPSPRFQPRPPSGPPTAGPAARAAVTNVSRFLPLRE